MPMPLNNLVEFFPLSFGGNGLLLFGQWSVGLRFFEVGEGDIVNVSGGGIG